jgi:hypothetical protein
MPKFQHTEREIKVLGAAHRDMMSRLQSGQRYDVVKLAWVDADGNVLRDDRAWLNSRKKEAN